jgi:hypothetical protein
MTDTKPTPIKGAAKQPYHTIRVNDQLYATVERAAKARAVGVSYLAEKLLEKGLELLVDPVLFDSKP